MYIEHSFMCVEQNSGKTSTDFQAAAHRADFAVHTHVDRI